MPGLGTIINTAAIVVGGLLGLLFKNLLTKSMEDTLLNRGRGTGNQRQYDADYLLRAGKHRRRASGH